MSDRQVSIHLDFISNHSKLVKNLIKQLETMFQAHKNNNHHLKYKNLQKEALLITDHMEDETSEQLQPPSVVSVIQVQ